MGLFAALGLPQPAGSARPAVSARPADATVQAAPLAPGTPGMSARLRDMAKWVWLAHRAWKKLSAGDRFLVFNQIERNYGRKFAADFLEFTKSGAKPDHRDYVTSLPQHTPKWFEDRGYRLLSRSEKQQWWIHPSGQQIYLVMDTGPYITTDLEKALRKIDEDHDRADALDDVAMRINKLLRNYNGEVYTFDDFPPPGPIPDLDDLFDQYLQALAAESSFLDGALADAAAIRASLLKKKVKLDEFDAAVEEKLSTPRRRVDLLMSDDRLDELDPSKQQTP
jgi:hypothetical protein